MMVQKSAANFRVFCLATVLLLGIARGAAPKSPLIGLTQAQVIEHYGEPPRSQIVAPGGRMIMFFPRERVVLRDGVVVDVELLPADLPAKRTPTPEPAPPTTTTQSPAPPTDPQPSGKAPAAAPENVPAAPAVPPSAAEPQLSIKMVRPPGSPAPAPKHEPAPAPPKEPPPVAKNPADVPAGVAVATKSSAQPTPPETPPSGSAPKKSNVGTHLSAPLASADTTAVPEPVDKVAEPATPPSDAAKNKAKAKAIHRRLEDAEFAEPEENIFTPQTYVIAVLAIGAGAGFLFWQRSQRNLAMAATAVSRAPFSAAPASSGGAMFPASLLANLEWKRFEELVEAYYSKTGVVAARTKTGPDSPVHIKISWKGEPRPFACVQCIAHPAGLIDVKPIQELFAVLTAEDIRRGYVVTTGKFNVAARDFAEEKHLTLMSGDIFVEKLNALPPSARAELIQEFSVGDYSTPSCPKCDAKMVRSAEDPAVWTCKAHPEVTIRAWK